MVWVCLVEICERGKWLQLSFGVYEPGAHPTKCCSFNSLILLLATLLPQPNLLEEPFALFW